MKEIKSDWFIINEDAKIYRYMLVFNVFLAFKMLLLSEFYILIDLKFKHVIYIHLLTI